MKCSPVQSVFFLVQICIKNDTLFVIREKYVFWHKCVSFFFNCRKTLYLFFYQKCVPDLVSKKRNSCFCIINVYHFLFDKVMPDFFLHKCVPIFGRKYILNILFYTQNMYHIFCLKRKSCFCTIKCVPFFFVKE